MSDGRDPPRWASTAEPSVPEDLRALFREAEHDLPSEAQLQSLAGRLGGMVQPAAAPVARAPLSRAGQLGLAGLAAGVVAVGIGVVALVTREPAVRQPSPAPSAAVSTAPAPSPTAELPGQAEQRAPKLEQPAPPASAAPAQAEPARPAPSGRSLNKAAVPSEAELLERARKALASDPAAALALTRSHEANYGSGLLRQEREVIAIEALRRLGRQAEAAARAERFAKTYPGSAHRRGVESGLGQ